MPIVCEENVCHIPLSLHVERKVAACLSVRFFRSSPKSVIRVKRIGEWSPSIERVASKPPTSMVNISKSKITKEAAAPLDVLGRTWTGHAKDHAPTHVYIHQVLRKFSIVEQRYKARRCKRLSLEFAKSIWEHEKWWGSLLAKNASNVEELAAGASASATPAWQWQAHAKSRKRRARSVRVSQIERHV